MLEEEGGSSGMLVSEREGERDGDAHEREKEARACEREVVLQHGREAAQRARKS